MTANHDQPFSPAEDRHYQIDVKRCFVRSCEGELAEMSYYERNNWITVEYKCNQCGKEFTVKVEL